MSRLVIRSRREDIKRFMNLVPHRIEKINEADASPIPASYGVNELASRLHPKKLSLEITDIFSLSDKIKIITLASPEGDKLPFFRAGQSINIKHGAYFTAFSLICAPNTKEYKIAAFLNGDTVSQFLFEQVKGAVIEASAPEGLFYYSFLRDKETVAAICDTEGMPAVISMAESIKSGNDSFRLKVFCSGEDGLQFNEIAKKADTDVKYGDISSALAEIEAMPEGSYSLFISGNEDFCEDTIKKAEKLCLDAGRLRLHIVNPAQTAGEAKKEFSCRVIYRDTEFSFTCKDNETLLSAFERNGVPSAAKCKVGECGYCRCKLIEGEIETINCAGVDSLREADKKYNYVHPCRSFARSNIVLAL